MCAKCGGRQFIFNPDGTTVACECRAAALAQLRLKKAEIPPRFINKSVDSFSGAEKKISQLRTSAKAFINNFPSPADKKGLIFMGTTGCGKTHLAIGILKAVIEKGYTGYYCNVVDFFTRLRDTFAGDTEYDEMDLLDKVARVNLLVLDDLGAEQPSVWKLDRLYALVNKRYEQNSPIIVTTNKLDVNDLEDFIGPRIVSRLCEMCQIMDKFPNADYRKKDLGK
ncbi:MAG TPA: ATP-binding protein [Candidatus Sumerlaeota bacterium]|nr:ATP-binding protein [Candidatus Sumerlaeota bacterium]HRU55233.1 ATP-binding protein [Candidatus Sumerlaeia bacterium]